jgi:elongation factor 3
MAEKTRDTIHKIGEAESKPEADTKALFMKHGAMPATWSEAQMDFVQTVANNMNKQNVGAKEGDEKIWTETFDFLPGVNAVMIEKVKTDMFSAGEVKIEEFVDDDETSPDLYKGSFSLAYGTLTLLRDTKLHLKKFKFYGLLGGNNCGKTTLMRAISREQVEGFPKRDELVTIFVEHEVEERQLLPPGKHDGVDWPLGKFNIDLSGIEFVCDTCNNVYKKDPPITLEVAEKTLGELGFGNPVTGVNPKAAAKMINPITTYSGGWKVKMQLACAQLVEADILMLDEPTGHMDVKNVTWMKNWLNAFPGSIISTSANTEFLDEMCTHIIDFQDRKLLQFKHAEKGKVLTHFVEKYPEKSAYFTLSNKKQPFNFPQPGPLEGVKSKGRAILKMSGVEFKYPTHEKPTVTDIALSVCMLSRVGVVGPNGAGKSTAIKLLIGELKPEKGTVWKHSGLRMAYVAQHAFHHLERHVNKTPVQYILWRFAGNDDRESLENQTKEINVDEEALRAVKWCVDSKSGVVRKCVPGEKGDHPVTPDTILNRRKNKQKKYEYEVKWMHKPMELSCWVERDTMISMGYEKMVCREDEKQAAAAGLMSKPLTAPSVEKCLKDFGLSAEEASHSPIASLSGGQKVKVVLAAAMWQNPHILILDEPTNYLDRDGLGSLSLGLQEFGGGVVIISHNMEFTNSVCQQKWIMSAESGTGRLREEGEVVGDETIDTGADGPDEITDAQGNKIEVNKAKTMTDKERKKAIKEIERRLKEHKKKNTLSDAEMWELQDKVAELKNEQA